MTRKRINSKLKGAKGEREWARLCREEGFTNTRRGQQYSGIEGEDVVGLPGIHQEVKRTEALRLYDAIAQAKAEARGKIPIVAHRRNNCEWVVIMTAKDWFKLYREYHSSMDLKERGEMYG